jgi:aspartate/methionine/tyrosine aminotransferase
VKLAGRLAHIDPFYVMECAKVAQEIARSPACDPALGGEPMIYLNIGEPDFTAPAPVIAAAEVALRAGRTQYTDAVGLPALRERISRWYASRWGVDVPARRIVVTAGASAGLQLVCQALFEAGDEVLMPDPSYPCNRHFVAATGATARLVPTTPRTRFQLDADAVRAHWRPQTRGVLLATPSNPTGTSIAPDELARIVDVVREKGGVAIVDEIYQGLSYDPAFERCALALGDDIVSVNSFSKYFSMTGWRLGWLVLPPAMMDDMGKLIEFNTSCAPTFVQRAGLAALNGAADFVPGLVQRLQTCRDTLLSQLQQVPGVRVAMPAGGMYAFFRVEGQEDSLAFAKRLVSEAGLGLAPGVAFGPEAEGWLRWCFASRDPARLTQGVERLRRQLGL